ncbi:MAG: glycoside hydrolase family 20 zincin-like fold domain-containing protein, partial [Tannerellaceae bacterium]
MKTKYILLCLLIVSGELFARDLDKAFQLLPQPQSVEVMSGKGIRYADITYLAAETGTAIPVMGTLCSNLPQSKHPGKGILLRTTTQNVPNSPEGYVLKVSSQGVTISAQGKAGLFYGLQTLEQLFEDSRDFGREIPAMQITDYPSLSYRAVHFDTKHHLDRMEYYYRAIDRLARYKVNAVIWEIEDKLRFTRRPEVAAPNAISKQEMAALCRYAIERNVE